VLPFFLLDMIRLQPNTATQTFYVSPYSAKKYLSTFTHYLIEFKEMSTSATYRFIANVTTDNERYTQIAIGTNTNDAINGSIKVENSGYYTFTIWGQNSSSNLDPTDASVAGECQQGLLQIVAQEAWNIPSIDIPNNVVYYE